MTRNAILALAAAGAAFLAGPALAADDALGSASFPAQVAQAAPPPAADPHHPTPQAGGTQPAQPPQPGAAPGGTGMMGMMGQGGMMPMMGMMGQGGMMPMMGMMGHGGMGMGPGGMGPGAPAGMGGPGMQPGAGMSGTVDRVEGRLAFVRAELKISEAQAPAWNAFAAALRANAAKLNEVLAKARQAAGQPPSLSQRLERQEQLLAARLDGVRAVRTAFAGLLQVLTDEQKKTAEEIVPWHGGLMAMGMM
jgi:hypothetical protein